MNETYEGYKIKVVQDDQSEAPNDWGSYTLAMAPSLRLADGGAKWSDYVDEDGMATAETVEKIKAGSVWPLSYSSHGPQCSYDLAYDSTDADGYLVFSADYIDGTSYEERKRYAREDIKTYSQWANGETYGYRLTNPYGDDDFDNSSCYGYYGLDEVLQAAHEAIDGDLSYDMPSRHAIWASEVHK